jgi:glutaredoxin 3
MARVQVYTTQSCPYCVAAKRLLTERSIAYEEIDVGGDDDDLRAAVIERSGGRRTVPQIFIDDRPIGGYEELAALDAEGALTDLQTDGK